MLGHTGLFVDRLVKVLFEGSVVLVLCQHELFDDGRLTGCFLLLELERFKINVAAIDRDIERSAAVKELLLVLCGDPALSALPSARCKRPAPPAPFRGWLP